MKRTFSFLAAGTALIAVTYGLVRLAYGLYLPDVQADLSLDAALAGAISAGASVVYCGGALVGFVAAPRRPRTLVVLAGGTAAVGTAGMAVATGPGLFAASAMLSSAAAGLASPALVELVLRNVAARTRDRAQTVVNAGTGPGLVVAGALALVLLPCWRTAWVVAAVASVVVAVLVLALDRGAPASAETPRAVPGVAWWQAHRRVLLAALLLGAGSAAVWTYGRALLTSSGAAEPVSTGAWIALGLGGTAVIGTARWTDALLPARTWALTAGVVAVSSGVLVGVAGVAPLALAACVAFGWGYTAATGALIAWTTRIDAARAPTGTAVLFVTLVLGQALGAAGAGVLVGSAGYGATFLAAGAVAAGAAALGLLRSPPGGGPVSAARRGAATVSSG